MKKQIKNALPAKSTSLVAAPMGGDEHSLTRYIQTVQKFPVLSAEEEYECATRWVKNQDGAAAEKLVASHLRLVVSVAYDFKNYGIPVTELIASGNMGLMQALQKFDPEKGFRFSTYAMFWIRAEIYDTIMENWSVSKIGTSAGQKRVFFNMSKARRALGITDNYLSDEQVDKVAKYLGVSENDVRKMSTRMAARDVSLNAPMRGDEDARDMLSNLTDARPSVAETVEQMEYRRRGYDLLRRHLAELPERDREILTARRLSDPAMTLEALSQKYNISRERVRQIEERAYNKLRDAILKETGGQI